MSDISLLIMAAGMGSRYGGLKQLDAVGPNRETIIDYSVYDAIQAGFSKVVFIIRKDFEDQFISQVTHKYADSIEVEFAFQDIHDLPNGFICPEGRHNPWGTGQAILSAKNLIHEPFAAINGDDFYGKESFQTIADHYRSGGDSFIMVAFRLENTLSTFGGVTRGICTIKDGKLETVIETENLKKSESGISSNRNIKLDGSEPVSMNMWGFTPILFDYLEEKFVEFLKKDGQALKSEFLIPTVVNEIIQSNKESVHILNSAASWFGVTYKKDKAYVIDQIQRLVDSGAYPSPLFE